MTEILLSYIEYINKNYRTYFYFLFNLEWDKYQENDEPGRAEIMPVLASSIDLLAFCE